MLKKAKKNIDLFQDSFYLYLIYFFQFMIKSVRIKSDINYI